MRTVLFGRLIALFVLLLFASCSKLTVEPTSAGIPAGSVMGEVATSGIAEPDSDDSIVGMPLRTIAPATLTVAELANPQNYTLKIRGKSRSNTLPEQVVQLKADGTFLIPSLTYGVWELTLTVYSGTSTNIQLTGSTSVTVDGSRGATARFVLTPRGVAGTGSFNIDVTWSAEDRDLVYSGWQQKIRKYELGLYSLETGAATAFVEDWTMNAGDNNNDPQTTFSWERRDIPAGEYLFKYTVTGGGLPDGASLCWQDNVYIEPGRETRQNITIPQMVIATQTPTNFVGTTRSRNSSGKYTGTLTWGSVYNGGKYELELLKYTTGTTHPTTDGQWTTAEGQAGSVVYNYNTIPGDPNNYNTVVGGRPRVTAGNLLVGRGTITLELAIDSGESYAARLRAVGAMGPSDWVYLAAPLVPVPVAPTSFSVVTTGSLTAAPNGTFPSTLDWKGGYVDAGGTWELQVLSFTGGTLPSNVTAWGNATGRTEHTLTSTVTRTGPVAVAGGSLAPGSATATLDLNDTANYYTARIRGKNSSGDVTGWLYLSNVMIPQPAIVGDSPTQLRGPVYDVFGQQVYVWDVTMSIWGPQAGSNLQMEWLRYTLNVQEDADLEGAAWDYLYSLKGTRQNPGPTYGSNGKSVSIKGAGTNFMGDMNDGSPFYFRIKNVTPYGDSAWYYYPVEVTQLP